MTKFSSVSGDRFIDTELLLNFRPTCTENNLAPRTTIVDNKKERKVSHLGE